MRRAIARRRDDCGGHQFAAKRGGSKLGCQGKGADYLDMLEAAIDSRGKMPEPRRADLPLLPSGQSERFYLERFMQEFGEDWNKTAIIDAPTGHALAVSAELFTDHKTGKSKIAKEGRSAYLRYLAETIKRPDEQWLHEGGHGDRAFYLLARFILHAGVLNTLAVFKESGAVWDGVTTYQTFDAVYFAGKRRDKRLVYLRHD